MLVIQYNTKLGHLFSESMDSKQKYKTVKSKSLAVVKGKDQVRLAYTFLSKTRSRSKRNTLKIP